MNKRLLVAAVSITLALAVGCKKGQQTANSNEPKQLPDQSTLQVNIASDGRKTEARVFEGGELLRATRITGPKVEPMVLVEFRDGRTAVLKDPNLVTRVLDASEEEIAEAATGVQPGMTTQQPAVPTAVSPSVEKPKKGEPK